MTSPETPQGNPEPPSEKISGKSLFQKLFERKVIDITTETPPLPGPVIDINADKRTLRKKLKKIKDHTLKEKPIDDYLK